MYIDTQKAGKKRQRKIGRQRERVFERERERESGERKRGVIKGLCKKITNLTLCEK